MGNGASFALGPPRPPLRGRGGLLRFGFIDHRGPCRMGMGASFALVSPRPPQHGRGGLFHFGTTEAPAAWAGAPLRLGIIEALAAWA